MRIQISPDLPVSPPPHISPSLPAWLLRRPLHDTDADDGQSRRWVPASSAPAWQVHNDDAAAASRSQHRVARSEQCERPLEQQRAWRPFGVLPLLGRVPDTSY